MKSKQVVWATFTLVNKSERCEKNPETVNNSQINVAGATKSENRRHECLESRVTNRVYQSCDSLRTCAEAVIFPPRVHVVYFILW